jgi:hypothetical protein
MRPSQRIDMRKPFAFPRTAGVVACIIGSATFALSAPKPGTKVGASSVWQLPDQFVTGAHTVCDKSAPASFAECVINQMAKAGASADAVSFTRELYKQSGGDVGIMTGFQAVGPVDFAWIRYPLRANTNYGLVLVNGSPLIVNVENLALLDRKTMQQTPQFKDLKAQFPQVDVWPGDRDGKTWPNSQTGPHGGSQFTVMSRLRPRRVGHIHLEFHGSGQVYRYDIRRHDPTALVTIAGRAEPTRVSVPHGPRPVSARLLAADQAQGLDSSDRGIGL